VLESIGLGAAIAVGVGAVIAYVVFRLREHRRGAES